MKKDVKNFLLGINNQLSQLDLSKPITPAQAKEEAMRIVSTIPNMVKNYFLMREQIQVSPLEITVYSLYQKELATKEPFGGELKNHYKTFKQGTVGYYLCQYLYGLGFYFRVWCGQIDILMTLLGGSSEGTLNFLKPVSEINIID